MFAGRRISLSTDGGATPRSELCTDTVRKTAIAQLEVGGQLVTIGSMRRVQDILPIWPLCWPLITTMPYFTPALQLSGPGECRNIQIDYRGWRPPDE